MGVGGDTAATVFVLAGITTAGAAAILAAAASRRATATTRRGWESLSAAAIVWALGALAGVIENGGAQLGPPRAGAAIAAAALALAGVLRLHDAPARLWGQARTVVDGLIVAVAAQLEADRAASTERTARSSAGARAAVRPGRAPRSGHRSGPASSPA